MDPKPTFRPSWQAALQTAITRLRKADPGGKIALLGIGNELRGDDAAGVRIIQALQARIGDRPDLLLLDTGVAPESFSGPLRRFGPGLVLLVDAAQIGARPGEVRWLAWQETEGISSSTHTLPPSILATYLVNELHCEVALLGVQPKALEFDDPISREMKAAISEVIQGLQKILA